MKNKQTKTLSLCLILGIGVGALLSGFTGEGFWGTLVNFGLWMRKLSESGQEGNIIAWIILFSLSAVPFLGLLYKRRNHRTLLLLLTTTDISLWAFLFLLLKLTDTTPVYISTLPLLVLSTLTIWLCLRWRKYDKVDCLLPLISLGIFFTMYFLVNPTLLSQRLLWMEKESIAQSWAMVCFGATLSAAIAWVLLRLLEQATKQPAVILPGLLRFAGFSIAFFVGFSGITELLSEIRSLIAANSDKANVWLSSSFSAVIITLRGVPGILGAMALLWGRDLAIGINNDPFSGETVLLAEEIAIRCKKTLKLSILLSLCANLLQLIFFSAVLRLHVLVSLPILPLTVCGILFLLCGYFRRAKELHEDNAGFI